MAQSASGRRLGRGGFPNGQWHPYPKLACGKPVINRRCRFKSCTAHYIRGVVDTIDVDTSLLDATWVLLRHLVLVPVPSRQDRAQVLIPNHEPHECLLMTDLCHYVSYIGHSRLRHAYIMVASGDPVTETLPKVPLCRRYGCTNSLLSRLTLCHAFPAPGHRTGF